MDAEALTLGHFAESISTKQAAADVLAPSIARAGQLMARALQNDGRIYSCGNGVHGFTLDPAVGCTDDRFLDADLDRQRL